MAEIPVIFLSSTWADLEEHRKALLFMFARLRKWVEAMEYFGAAILILAVLRQPIAVVW